MTRSSLLRVSMALLVLPALAGCDVKVGDDGISVDLVEGRASEEWMRSYELPPGGTLEIVNVNGGIEASAASGSLVEVRATREARAGSDEEARTLLENLEIAEDVGPDRVRIESRVAQGSRGSGFGWRNQLSVRYEVRLPPGLTATLKTENGGLQLAGIEGTVAASTTNGGINGEDLSGAVRAATVNGGVRIALTAVTGPVELSSVNGGVRLELPPGVKGSLEANAVNGGVSIDDALALAVSEQDRRHVSGTLNGGGPRISAQTTNGGVRVSALE